MPPPTHRNPIVRPDQRPNWDSLNQGQKNYAWSSFNAQLTRLGYQTVPPPAGVNTQKPWNNVTPDPNAPNYFPETTTKDPHDIAAKEIMDTIANVRPDHAEHSIDSNLNYLAGKFSDSPSYSPVESESDMSPGTGYKRPYEEGGEDSAAKRTPSVVSSANSSEAHTMEISPGSVGSSASQAIIADGTTSGMSGAQSAIAGKIPLVPRPVFSRNNQILKFNKVHKLLSYGLEFNPILEGSVVRMTTSLLEIPWDRIFFYLSRAELSMLPDGAHAVKAHVSIIQRNTRISFEVGAGTSGLATLNQNKFGVKAMNINAKCSGTNRRYSSYDPSNPMRPTGTANAEYGWAVELYGYEQGNSTFNTHQPIHTLGIPYHLNNYFTLAADAYLENSRSPGWENYSSFVEEFDMNATIGSVIHEQTYEFGFAPLSIQIYDNFPFDYTHNVKQKYNQHPWTEFRQQARGNNNSDASTSSTITKRPDTAAEATGVNPITNDPARLLEQSDLYAIGTHPMNSRRQPSIHVGVKPVPKLTTTLQLTPAARATEFADTEAYFEVSATLWVEVGFPCPFPAGEVRMNAGSKLVGLAERPENAVMRHTTVNENGVLPILYDRYNLTIT